MKIIYSNVEVSGCMLLTIAFVVLKLCGVITWSWLWVLSPIWLGILAVFIVLSIMYGIAAIRVKKSLSELYDNQEEVATEAQEEATEPVEEKKVTKKPRTRKKKEDGTTGTSRKTKKQS